MTKKDPPIIIPLVPCPEVTTKQAAEILHVSARAVLQMIADGRLEPTRKLPGRTTTYLLSREQVLIKRKERRPSSRQRSK